MSGSPEAASSDETVIEGIFVFQSAASRAASLPCVIAQASRARIFFD
jgi:hypothetical protein